MSIASQRLRAFLDAWPRMAVVEVREAAGSTPREVGAWMMVSSGATFGTIGGGQLEFMSIDSARQLLADGRDTALLDIPLGPEIGQCCGGRVKIDIAFVDAKLREAIPLRLRAEERMQPHVYLFGGGHVGHALAEALSLLPLHVTVVETRSEALDGLTPVATPVLTALPEETVRDAPPGSAFVVLTHDHALDFLIVAEALRRDDAAYIGMIGSKTKSATFRSWYLREAEGDERRLVRLVCPIGGTDVRDKRPAVIAALASAEILRALSSSGSLRA